MPRLVLDRPEETPAAEPAPDSDPTQEIYSLEELNRLLQTEKPEETEGDPE